MTTPINADDDSNLGDLIQAPDELLGIFSKGEKPRDTFKIGTEHEKFGFYCESKSPIDFDGQRGIAHIFKGILEEAGSSYDPTLWAPVLERGGTVGLFADGASISLEPGGQLELSGAPLSSTQETCEEVNEHLRLLQRHALPSGIGFLGIGYHPTASFEDFPQLPKGRYAIMDRYMQQVGSRGRDMMKCTATIQANFDFENESDMRETMQAAMEISPIISALFVNSPFKNGKPGSHLSERMLVWQDTDLARSGFVEQFLRADFSYQTYLDWALDVPMYFIRRQGRFHDVAGASFRDFIRDGLNGFRAHRRDFEDHLTTCFPEVRLKNYIEVRGADAGAWSHICALPALWKGLLYDVRCRDEIRSLMARPSAEELTTLNHDVARIGFKARYREQSVLSFAEEVLRISKTGLRRLQLESGGPDETVFLKKLDERVEAGETFADRLLRLYHEDWGQDMSRIWKELEFFPGCD